MVLGRFGRPNTSVSLSSRAGASWTTPQLAVPGGGALCEWESFVVEHGYNLTSPAIEENILPACS